MDDTRHILYARTQASSLLVYDLGPTGADAPRQVAETTDFLGDAARALGGGRWAVLGGGGAALG